MEGPGSVPDPMEPPEGSRMMLPRKVRVVLGDTGRHGGVLGHTGMTPRVVAMPGEGPGPVELRVLTSDLLT